jgi:DNA topoisomerase-1
MSREEILEYYRRVPIAYRNETFWTNCPFSKRELQTRPGPLSPEIATNSGEEHALCEIDGKEVPITSWKMEPPGVFLGRGDHPLRGSFRRRVVPEDVTLNLDSSAPVPKLPRGRKWGAVVHQPFSAWLWSWTDPLLGKIKYVYPHPSSENHILREIEKFETARELKAVIRNIRFEYRRVLKNWKTESLLNLETALILLLIDQLGIRIGNPGSQTGASTLLGENILLFPEKRKIRVRFVGKDSIQYDQEMHAEDFVLQSLRKIKPENPKSSYFPNTSSREINAYLHSINPNLKAKVFRTYNASEIFQEGLRRRSRVGDSLPNLVRIFREVNIEVARFCNHRRVGVLNKMKEGYSPKTSITNYVDPRIIYAWSKRFCVPIERVYSKILLQRFQWAESVEGDFVW